MKVVIINYGMGNLGSVRRAFEECGAQVLLSDEPRDLEEADRIVLPGVGAFRDGMHNLAAAGWPDKLREALQNPRVTLFGICLGMQLLAEYGHEGETTKGLGLIPGEVHRLTPTTENERIPHVGWNEVHPSNGDSLFHEIPPKTDFYFVHSYHLVPTEPEHAIALTPYCGRFVAAVRSRNVLGTQFHPEKSSRPGFRLIKNFLSWTPI
jgi:glutamine amidotransferase